MGGGGRGGGKKQNLHLYRNLTPYYYKKKLQSYVNKQSLISKLQS